MKAKKILKEIFTDPKHWAGWALSTFAIAGVLNLLFSIDFFWNFTLLGSVFASVVVVDAFKHVAKLQ